MTQVGRMLAIGLLFAAGSALGQAPVVTDFDESFHYAYLSFEKGVSVEDGVVHVVAENGQGGAGINQKMDLSKFGDFCPVLHLKSGPNNRAATIMMFFAGTGTKRMFTYKLDGVGPDAFTAVAPNHAQAVSPVTAGEPDQSFDPAAITTFQVQGDWKPAAVDVYIDRIELVAPTEAMRTERAKQVARLVKKEQDEQRKAEERRLEVARLISSAPHPPDGPEVQHIGAVAQDTIGLTIQAGSIVRRKQMPYEPQDGDTIQPSGKSENVLVWEHGKIADLPKGTELLRPDEGDRKVKVGDFVVNQEKFAPGPMFVGTKITDVTAGAPAAYRITSSDDPAFAEAKPPAAVHVKSKPTGQVGANNIPVRHLVYLQFPNALKAGATYTIEFVGVNTRQRTVDYTHEPRRTRSEAIHVTQIGYRPDDPFKRAYLSLWMGSGGTPTYDAKRFEIIDEADSKTVHEGDIVLGFAADRKESIRGDKNHTMANVYYLDFHDLNRPGTYRVFVPGIGTSYPFRIADDVWDEAFKVSMHGFLSHRSGIALGAPFTEYERPRPMHPADGIKVFELDVTFWNGESDAVHQSLRRLLGPGLDESRLKVYPGAWGGYMDAGDWDRRSQHLVCSWAHLELADLYPEFFKTAKLALPPSEVNDNVPDVINEALWNLDFYRRLQRDSGGVGGGVESTSHPRPGEASWQESLLLGTFAPDPETSLRYAACAAQAARLLADYDKALANTYANSAKRAWTWANENEDRVIAEAKKRFEQSGGKKTWKDKKAPVRDMRALAAVALYRLTGDASYHDAFKVATALVEGGDPGRQLDATFAYAVLPDAEADAALKQKARSWLLGAADRSIAFAEGNAFSVTCREPMLPVIGYVSYYSVPETTIGPVLPRAYYLTGDEKYLRAAVAAAQFSAGANPMNMTMTKGVGHDDPKQPLHVDAGHAGIEPPDGITVYGPTDPALRVGYTDWAHQWYLGPTMVPDSRAWPTAESYVDLSNWPVMTEYTVHQCFRGTSHYWGFLAARGK